MISHDCDICHPSFDDEPYVEIALARNVGSGLVDGNFLHGKNPRVLQFYVELPSGRKLFETRLADRRNLDRHLLEQYDGELTSVSVAQCRVLRQWLARRYSRTSLAHAFNERAEPARKFLSEKLKSRHRGITGFYLQGDIDHELQPDQTYKLVIFITVPEGLDNANQEYTSAEDVQALTFRAFSKCSGINLLDVKLVSEADVTIADLHRLVRWDYSDYLSHKP